MFFRSFFYFLLGLVLGVSSVIYYREYEVVSNEISHNQLIAGVYDDEFGAVRDKNTLEREILGLDYTKLGWNECYAEIKSIRSLKFYNGIEVKNTVKKLFLETSERCKGKNIIRFDR